MSSVALHQHSVCHQPAAGDLKTSSCCSRDIQSDCLQCQIYLKNFHAHRASRAQEGRANSGRHPEWDFMCTLFANSLHQVTSNPAVKTHHLMSCKTIPACITSMHRGFLRARNAASIPLSRRLCICNLFAPQPAASGLNITRLCS